MACNILRCLDRIIQIFDHKGHHSHQEQADNSAHRGVAHWLRFYRFFGNLRRLDLNHIGRRAQRAKPELPRNCSISWNRSAGKA